MGSTTKVTKKVLYQKNVRPNRLVQRPSQNKFYTYKMPHLTHDCMNQNHLIIKTKKTTHLNPLKCLYPDSGISMDEEIVLGDMIWSYNKAEL